MANSKFWGPLNPPMGMCRIGPVTPGVLGYLDFADPSTTALLGNTPGVLGWLDGADPTWLSRARSTGVVPNGVVALADGSVVSNGGATQAVSTDVEITLAMLKAADGSNTDEYYNGLLDAMKTYAKAYAINSNLRIAHFLSQIGHESGFKVVEESGSYSAKRMREVFGCKGGMKNYDKAKDDCTAGRLRDKLWTDEATYSKNSAKLLGFVYASRMGNGDETSGEGYKYRGRGMMQLTGKDNYTGFTNTHNTKVPGDKQDFVKDPDLLVTETKYGVESAFYFWDARGCNALADKDDIDAVTKAVNGGLNGKADRETRLNAVKKVMGL